MRPTKALTSGPGLAQIGPEPEPEMARIAPQLRPLAVPIDSVTQPTPASTRRRAVRNCSAPL